jgi:hypothetical protein
VNDFIKLHGGFDLFVVTHVVSVQYFVYGFRPGSNFGESFSDDFVSIPENPKSSRDVASRETFLRIVKLLPTILNGLFDALRSRLCLRRR